MRKVFAAMVSGLALASALSTAPALAKGGEESALRALDQQWCTAFSHKDMRELLDYYADDAVVMDPGPALEIRGKDAIRRSFTSLFEGIESPSLRLIDPAYRTEGNLGYGHATFEMSYKDKKTGQMVTVKGRTLTVFEKRGGKWLAVADHASIPMPDESSQPAK